MPNDIDFNWREDYNELHGSLESQRRANNFVNAASRIALAIMAIYRGGEPMSIPVVVMYVHEQLVPRGGWKNTGPNHFDQTQYEQLVLPVVAALKDDNPGRALIYLDLN